MVVLRILLLAIFGAIALLFFWILLPNWLLLELRLRDLKLPAGKRFLKNDMIVVYRLLWVLTGFFGTVLFFLHGSSEIDSKVFRGKIQETGGMPTGLVAVVVDDEELQELEAQS